MKRVLMISPYFVPRRRVGSYRAFHFAMHLGHFGYTPYVLNLPDRTAVITELEEKILKKINRIDIYPVFDKTGIPKHATNVDKNNFSSAVAGWIDKQTPTDTWIYLFLLKYFTILKKVKSVNPDIIWATGDPWSSLWLGRKLSRKLDKPFVCDFRDPWTLSSVPIRERSGFSRFFDAIFEKKIIHAANKIIFTSKTAEKSYMDYYNLDGDKISTIYNSFSSDVVYFKPKSNKKFVKFNPSHLNLIFFGRFRRLSPAAPVVEVLKRANEMNPAAVEHIRIHSFGATDDISAKVISDAGLSSNFVQHEPVVPEEKFSVLNQADHLLLSTHPNRDQIIPAKLWDYVAAGKPLFSIASNPEVEKIIEECSAGVHFYPSETEKAAEMILKLFRNKNKKAEEKTDGMQPWLNALQFEAKRRAEELASIFDELTINE